MVLVCHKHYLPTYLARVFTVFESVSVPHAFFSCTRMYLPTNLRMRNATYSARRVYNNLYKPTARTLVPFINPRRACAARVTVLGLSVRPSVRPSVRLSGTPYSSTTRNKAVKKCYQRVQCHTGLIFKIAIFVKVLRSNVMA